MTWNAPEIARADEPFAGDERAMLDGFLDWHRATLLRNCSGLTGEQLARRAVPPSALSLLGLVRHLADVERTWLRRRFGGQEVDALYARPDRLDAAFAEVDPARAEADIAALVGEWERCQQAVAGLPLDATFTSERWGEMSLRWAYLHLIGEYAHHCGHADLLRERIDGATGL
jgi:uncharacterized damage-inducible protein DinB